MTNCKYCNIPFTVIKNGEDDYTVFCDKCGYDVS